MIYIELTRTQFQDAFTNMGRGDQFSYDGFSALYDYLDTIGDDHGYNLDVIGVCCEFSEIDIKDIEQETGCESLDDLEQNTSVLRVDDETIIYVAF